MEVLRKAQGILDEMQLRELQTVLWMVFDGCEIIQDKQELRTVDRSWAIDLEEYCMSKALEGLSPKTLSAINMSCAGSWPTQIRRLEILQPVISQVT